jgi:hypothetical protein
VGQRNLPLDVGTGATVILTAVAMSSDDSPLSDNLTISSRRFRGQPYVRHDFKLEQGFTPDEILAKARSLKGVLEPFSVQTNLGLLERAGFVDTMSVVRPLGGVLA